MKGDGVLSLVRRTRLGQEVEDAYQANVPFHTTWPEIVREMQVDKDGHPEGEPPGWWRKACSIAHIVPDAEWLVGLRLPRTADLTDYNFIKAKIYDRPLYCLDIGWRSVVFRWFNRCDDKRAAYFAGYTRRAAELGHGPAMGEMAQCEPETWARCAALQGNDAFGWYEYACMLHGSSLWDPMLKTTNPAAFDAVVTAAKLGHHEAMSAYAVAALVDSPEWIIWKFRSTFTAELREFLLTNYDPTYDFLAGYMMYTFPETNKFAKSVRDRLVTFYLDTCEVYSKATLTWLLCARRLHIYKDVALLVARMVWNGRLMY